MRKITTILILTVCWTICNASNHTDTSSKKNFVYFNPLPFIKNTFQLNYERKLTKYTGLLISGGYTLVDCYDDGKRGGNGELQYRIYLSTKIKKAKRISYISPYVRFQYIESTLGYYNYDYNRDEYYFVDQPDVYVSSYSAGLLVGYKWIYNSQLIVDAYIGAGGQQSYYTGKKAEPGMDLRYYGYISGFVPKIGVQFGYKF